MIIERKTCKYHRFSKAVVQPFCIYGDFATVLDNNSDCHGCTEFKEKPVAVAE